MSISNKCCKGTKIKELYHVSTKQYEAAQMVLLILIRNVSWAANQHIIMISEGSRDTEDWSNDAENTALIIAINYSLTHIHMENSSPKLK